MRFLRVTVSLSFVMLAVLVSAGFAAAAGRQPVRIALLPVQHGTMGDYSYLDTVIDQMLVTRLSGQDLLTVAPPGAPGRQSGELRELLRSGDYARAAERLDVDWLAAATMESQPGGLRVDVTCYPAAPGGSPRSFGFTAGSPDEVIPAITRLAGEIGTALTGGETEVAAEPEADAAISGGMSGFQTPHPERAYRKGLYGGATVSGPGEDRFESKGVRKSSTLPIEVESMTLGDLDGDGVNDLVAASRSRIRVFHFSEGRFQRVAEYDFSPRMKMHVINIADPGDTGTMKLFVSGNEGRFASSAVFTWDGSKTLQPLQQDLRWYIRPVRWPGRGLILAGQQTSPNISDDFLAPGVYELSLDLDSGRIERGDKLVLPEKTNLFDFLVEDLNGDKEPETMVIDRQERLLVYDAALNLVWVSSANYGGSTKFFGPPLAQKDDLDYAGIDSKQQDLRKLVYIPGRLDSKDITGDGLPEVVVSTNEVGLAEYLENYRSYDGGAVACLTWRGSGLLELWRTNHIDGYVADYVFDGEGEVVQADEALFLNRLYVAQIPSREIWETLLPGSDASRILAYEMTVKKEEPK